MAIRNKTGMTRKRPSLWRRLEGLIGSGNILPGKSVSRTCERGETPMPWQYNYSGPVFVGGGTESRPDWHCWDKIRRSDRRPPVSRCFACRQHCIRNNDHGDVECLFNCNYNCLGVSAQKLWIPSGGVRRFSLQCFFQPNCASHFCFNPTASRVTKIASNRRLYN